MCGHWSFLPSFVPAHVHEAAMGRRERKWEKNDYKDMQDKRLQLLW